MKIVLVFVICLLAACGDNNPTPTTTNKPLEYFSQPVAVASMVVDQTGGIQAANLVITGVSRTVDTIILNFSITVTNNDAAAQDVNIEFSGRDRYNLEALKPVITASMLPNETRIINHQEQFNAALLYQVESWLVQSVALSSEQPNIISEPLPDNEPDQSETTAIAIDPSGTIQLLNIEPLENFRTIDRVNFSTKFQFQNLSSMRINFHWAVNGLTASDELVFSRSLNTAADGDQTLNMTMSYGEPLTISQYNSITKWTVTDFARY